MELKRKKEPGIVRLKVNLNQETADALLELSETQHVNITEVLRRAVAVLKFVEDQRAAGRILLTTDRDGKDRWEVVLVE